MFPRGGGGTNSSRKTRAGLLRADGFLHFSEDLSFWTKMCLKPLGKWADVL